MPELGPNFANIHIDEVQIRPRIFPQAPRRPRPNLRVDADGNLEVVAGLEDEEVRQVEEEPAALPEGKMKAKLPPFKMPYDSGDEIARRLRGGIFVINGLPYYVHNSLPRRDGDYILYLYDEHQKNILCRYSAVDTIRTPQPCYVSFPDNRRGTFWLYRRPSTPQDQIRGNHHGDYAQGMTSRNSLIKPVGMGIGNVNYPPQYPSVIKALKSKDNLPWKGEYEALMAAGIIPDMRLTDNIAVFTKGKRINVEYKGRALGYLKDDKVVLSEEDKDTPWIYEDLFQAGLGSC